MKSFIFPLDDINERFTGFVDVSASQTGEALASEMLAKVDSMGLDRNNMRGTTTDGAGKI